ncbi:MAG: 4-hydroxy-3-methylbut-2-en-1-yl diphosphate synthase [Bacteroidales bacterium]
MQHYFNYNRRNSLVVEVGTTPIGGKNQIRVQSMTNTSTMDTDGSVDQAVRIIENGGELVRLTAQGVRESNNLENIHNKLRSLGYNTPLVADIHFNPNAADRAAEIVEKVRINPGNYVDSVKRFSHIEYTDQEYAAEITKIRDRFIPFLNICKTNNTAIRIGVNHGSLSDRIISRYGDTPQGMVESALEFLRICISEKFLNVVISMKSSNTIVMVNSVRLLIERMNKENMSFPIHLGVTEAGDGEDGRIKSALGIGALLADGIGDTLRVSLSEDPELEIPVGKELVNYFTQRIDHPHIQGSLFPEFCWSSPIKRATIPVKNIGGNNAPIVIAEATNYLPISDTTTPDYIIGSSLKKEIPSIIDYTDWDPTKDNSYPLFRLASFENIERNEAAIKFLSIATHELNDELICRIRECNTIVLLLHSNHINIVGDLRSAFHRLLTNNCTTPVVIRESFSNETKESLQIKAAADYGALLLDGFGDGISIQNQNGDDRVCVSIMFGILQASRLRVSKTEYISCPSCGRTLFNLQRAIAKIKERTSHLKGLKIGIMGCIVNGPGEMADADYGYVGAGPGKVSLYKKKECIEKNIPEDQAVEKLIELIKSHGDWKEQK